MTFYQKAIGLSLLLHGSLLGFLLVSPVQHSAKTFVTKKSNSLKKQEIIQTAAIDSMDIDKEIERIQTEKRQKIKKEEARQRTLAKKASQAKAQRLLEEKALEALKAEQKKIARAQQNSLIRQRKKLLALKKARQKEAKRLLSSQKKRDALNKKMAQEKKERLEEVARNKIQAKKEKEQKLAQAKQKAEADAKLREEKQQLVNAEVNRYKALLINAISQNWILPPSADRSLSCRFEIKLAPSGEVKSVTLLRSSGDPILDRSAQTAIYNASPLPVPSMPEAFDVFKVVSLTVKPENV